MQTSQEHQSSSSIQRLFYQPMQQIEPYCLPHFQILDSNVSSGSSSQGAQVSFQNFDEQFFTLESSPAIDYVIYNSPSTGSISSNRSPFSPICSQSYGSDPHYSPDNIYGSPFSGSSIVGDGSGIQHVLREIEVELLESDIDDSSSCSFNCVVPPSSLARSNRILEMAANSDLKQVLIACAEALSDADMSLAENLMDLLEHRVSVFGDPVKRLSAYVLEGLKARRLSSGSNIYKNMKCKEPTVLKEPTGSELMSYMYVLSTICPYYKFAYMSANVVIGEAMENETKIHIIDFQIAQGGQWISFIQALARRPGGPPHIRITGIDDSQSVHARGGGLQLVEQKLAQVAESCGVPFEFHGAALSGCEVELENLRVRPGEALAVNFPYMLHHMPDESVNTTNHRDRLLRLVKSLSPKVVTLLEQESNTNTTAFIQRFHETLDYYTAMFESIDAALPREDKQRTNAEMHCVARDIVNIIACEGVERVERHELFGKWRKRLDMAGFSPCPLSSSVGGAIKDMLKEYNENYWVEESDGALFLGWKWRRLVTSSAWRLTTYCSTESANSSFHCGYY